MNNHFLSRYLPAAIVVAGAWAIALFFYLSTGFAGALEGQYRDPDDYMRLLQVGRWLDGAGWYDTTMPRLNPPAGIELHWSRLADLPLAAVIALTEHWLGREGAMHAAALAVPSGLFLGFLALTVWMARPSLPRAAAPLMALFAIFPPPLFGHFLPGRVDHHGWQIMLVAFALGAFSRMVARPAAAESGGGPERLAEAVGIAFALGLWIGGEIVPWLAAFNAVLAALWVADGRAAARLGLRFSGALVLACAALLALARPPGRLFEVSCDSFSILHVVLASAAFAFWLVLDRGRWRDGTRTGRAALAAAAAAVAGALLFALFPECRSGPYAAVPPELAEIWLKNVSEAKPLWTAFSRNPIYLPLFLSGVLLAGASAAFAAWRGKGRARRLWLMHLWLLASALAMSFWQLRTLSFALLFALVPLVRFACGLASFRALVRPGPLRRVAATMGGVLLCGPVALLILPMVADLAESGSLGKVATGKPEAACDLRLAASVLNDPRGFGDRPRLIAAFIDMGPEILFRTRHAVLAAPYHRNTAGILDSFAFLDAADAGAAWELAQRRGIEAVLFCPTAWEMRAHRRGVAGVGGFLSALAVGEAPDWLEPVLLPPASRLRLYVRRP